MAAQRSTASARFAGLLFISACLALGGCSAPVEESSESGGDALTLPDGDRFVESIADGVVVLKRQVDGKPFPFAAGALGGKAVLIHPVKGKSETGVYARVLDVTETATTFVLKTQPLLFEEMETLHEDEIIRIFLDRSLADVSSAKPSGITTSSDPFGVIDTGLRPQTVGGLVMGELATSAWVDLGPKVTAGGALRVTFEDGSLTLNPRTRVRYVKGRGIELGAQFDAEWNATLAVDGRVYGRGTIWEPPRIEGPRGTFVIPIGFVPVPVTLGLSATARCSVSGAFTFDGRFKPSVSLSIGGSSFLDVSSDPTKWVTPGEWPYHATGRASLPHVGKLEIAPTTSIDCLMPRVDLAMLVAGVAGGQLSLVLNSRTAATGTTVNAALRVGARAELFGKGAGAEVEVVSWRP